MSNPNDPFPLPPENASSPHQPPYGAPPSHQPPYGGPPPQQPYGGPPQPPYGAPPAHQPPYGAPPQPPYGGPSQPPYGAPPQGNSKLLIGIIAGLILIIVVGATLYFAGVFGGSDRKDYSISAPGEAPPLTKEFLLGGTWREECGNYRHLEFDHTGNFRMTTDDGAQFGRWTMAANGVSIAIDGRSESLAIQPVGPDTMRATSRGETKTLIRC